MIDENGISRCDYCGLDQGEFNDLGNHSVCNTLIATLLELEETSFKLSTALARLEQVEAALKPFAEVGKLWLPVDVTDKSDWTTETDDVIFHGLPVPFNELTVGDMRRAAAALDTPMGETK